MRDNWPYNSIIRYQISRCKWCYFSLRWTIWWEYPEY